MIIEITVSLSELAPEYDSQAGACDALDFTLNRQPQEVSAPPPDGTIGRRAAVAGIPTRLGNHSFRATGITAYLTNGGALEKAAAMANHVSSRTRQLYERRRDELSLDEVEQIVI